MANETPRNPEAHEAGQKMDAAQTELYVAGQAYLQDPTPENKEAMDKAHDKATETTAEDRRLTGGSQ
ncbi:hypothetical protein ACQEU6_27065 [Spirillospora sp. CA-108201]